MTLHTRMLIKELFYQRPQITLLILCVALAVVGVSTLGGFEARINESVARDARRLHAADVIVASSFPLTPAIEQSLDTMQRQGMIRTARAWEFYTLTRTPDGSRSLLTAAKTVEAGYPFYGTVELQSGRAFAAVLIPGGIVVEQGLLDRLGLVVGDRVQIGDADFQIVDVVLSEPDRPVTVFSFGPRVFINAADRQRLGLIEKGSRVRHKALVQILGPLTPDALAQALQAVADPVQERIDTFRSADSRLKRFFDNLIFFLKLISIFTLLLAGIAVHSVFEALLRARLKTITVMKALGTPNGFIMRLYLGLALMVGLVGTLGGLLLGVLLQGGLTRLLAGLLPAAISGPPAWGALAESLFIGLVAVLLFAARPILQLRRLRPATLFRYESPARGMRWGEWLIWGITALFFALLILRHLEDARTGSYFIGGALILLAVIYGLCRLALGLLKRIPWRNLLLRQAVRGLFRPRNGTQPVLVTLTASTTIILAIYLVENNLRAAFVNAYPTETPNTFVLDIQPEQMTPLRALVAQPLIFYPVIRARLTAINGVAVDFERERRRKSDNLARPFNLTYRADLLDDEALIQGESLFQPGKDRFQVSVLDRVAEIGNIRLGDRLDFNIQGVPLTAVVSSIRTRTHEGLQPYFYFVFPEETLRAAPQTLFTAIREVPAHIPQLQNRLVAAFPNVTVIDASQTIQHIAAALSQFARLIRFFTLFSVAAGLLLVIGSIVATRAARIREAVYYQILGARRGFVQWVFAAENMFLGLLSAALGLLLAQLIAWAVCTQRFDIAYDPQSWASLLALAVATTGIAALGWGASRSIMAYKPIHFLRAHATD